MKTIVTIIIVGALLYLGIALALYLMQRRLIYFPTPPVEVSGNLRTLEVTAADGVRLNIIVANPDQPSALMYFGGNAEQVADTAAELAAAVSDHTIYLVNYRAYGGSGGYPTEANLFADASLLFDRLSSDHQQLSVIGRSLGSGVACWLASQRQVERLVLITPFDSVANIAKDRFALFPVRWLLRDKFDSFLYAPGVQTPVLMLMAGNDQIIPVESSNRLQSRFTAAVTAHVFENYGHNDLQLAPAYYTRISEFINQ